MVVSLERGANELHMADATATPLSLASLKSRSSVSFWCWLTQVVLEKRLLNRCLSVTRGPSQLTCTENLVKLDMGFVTYLSRQTDIQIHPCLRHSLHPACCHD